MESQPQNPEFRINPENFHPCADTFANKLEPDQAAQNTRPALDPKLSDTLTEFLKYFFNF